MRRRRDKRRKQKRQQGKNMGVEIGITTELREDDLLAPIVRKENRGVGGMPSWDQMMGHKALKPRGSGERFRRWVYSLFHGRASEETPQETQEGTASPTRPGEDR